jgi:hypothetical protein
MGGGKVNKYTVLIPLSLFLISLSGCGLVEEPNAGNGGGYIVPPAPIAPAPPSVIDGYGNPAPELQRNQPAQEQPSQTIPMLENPDAESEEWSDEVWAANQEAADRACQDKADTMSQEGGTVITVQGKAQMVISPKPGKRGKPGTDGRYVCRFRSEV